MSNRPVGGGCGVRTEEIRKSRPQNMSPFDLSVIPGGVAGFQAAISDTYFPYEIERTGSDAPLDGAIATCRIGPLRMTRTYVNGAFCGHRRTTALQDRRKCYVLMLLEEGGDVCLHGRRKALAHAGELVLMNADAALATEQKAGGVSLAVSFSGQLLSARFAELDDWCLVPLDTSEGAPALLRDAIACYWRRQRTVAPAESNELAEALVHLLAAAYKRRTRLPPFSSRCIRMHFVRVRDLVEANLDDPELSVELVAHRLGVSKSYLYMIMNEAGTTLGRFVLEQRLERSRQLLADPSMGNRQIADIAYACGFQDLSHFSRRFSERFGRSPRAFRGKAQALAGAESA